MVYNTIDDILLVFLIVLEKTSFVYKNHQKSSNGIYVEHQDNNEEIEISYFFCSFRFSLFFYFIKSANWHVRQILIKIFRKSIIN